MIKISIANGQNYKKTLQTAGDRAASVLGQDGSLGAAVRFVTEKEMRALNLKHRGMDKPTDVLSFPNLNLKKPVSANVAPVTAGGAYDTDADGFVFLGDIAICGNVAERQAAEYGRDMETEITRLFVHGLLHLFGFDHIEKGDEKLMQSVEEEIEKR